MLNVFDSEKLDVTMLHKIYKVGTLGIQGIKDVDLLHILCT